MHFMLTLILMKTFHHYLWNCHYADILVTLPCKNLSIGNLAKLSLSLLCRHLDNNQSEKSLSLTQSDVHIILKVLCNKILSEDEEKASWHTLSKDVLLLALKGFCLFRDNCLKFIKQGGLDIFTTILDSMERDEQESCLLLLWQLSYSIGPEIMGHGGTELLKKLDHLPASEDSNLFTLKVLVPHCLLQTVPQGEVPLMTMIT